MEPNEERFGVSDARVMGVTKERDHSDCVQVWRD